MFRPGTFPRSPFLSISSSTSSYKSSKSSLSSIFIFLLLSQLHICLSYDNSINRSVATDIDALIAEEPSLVNVTLQHHTFDLKDYKDLTALYIDGKTAYVAGSNILLELSLSSGGSSDFELIKKVSTEPLNDDECLESTNESYSNIIENLNVENCRCPNINNTITTIFADNNIVLACGSRAQGRCFIYNRRDISRSKAYYTKDYSPEHVFHSGRSSVVFQGKLHDPSKSKDVDVYYVGFEEDCERPFSPTEDYAVPFISARSFSSTPPAPVYSNSERNFASRLIKPAPHSDSNRFGFPRSRFIYGFDDDEYAYFVTVHHGSDTHRETRIGRTCHRDPQISTYTEIPVRCDGLNIAKSATHFVRTSNSRPEKTLVMAFNSERDSLSKVCHFRLGEIDEMFVNATRNCFESGSQSELMEEFGESQTICALVEQSTAEQDANLCVRSKNRFILGKVPLEPQDQKPLLTLKNDSILTLAAEKDPVSHENNRFILMLVTGNDKIIRFDVEEEDEELRVLNNFIKPVENAAFSSKVAPVYSHATQSFYIMTKQSMIRVPVGNCSIYTSCRQCNARKRNCLWWNGTCTEREQVPKSQRGLFCPPEVYSYHPSNGPIQGGTVLTFHGFNFGNTTGQPESKENHMEVTLGDRKCVVEKRNNTVVKCRIDENEPADLGNYKSDVTISMNALDISDTSLGYFIRGNTNAKNFRFVNTTLRGIYPSYGPISGGTDILIYGSNLNAGSNLEITFGGHKCYNRFRNESIAVCNTSKINLINDSDFVSRGDLQINVKIDSAMMILNNSSSTPMKYEGNSNARCNLHREFNDFHFCAKVNQFLERKTELPISESFQYRPKPVVEKAENMHGIRSGNVTFTFHGSNLGSSAFPLMAVKFGNMDMGHFACTANPKQDMLECPLGNKDVRTWVNKDLRYKLRFDGKDIKLDDNKLWIHDDPIFENFSSVKTSQNKKIEFKGKNLAHNLPYKIIMRTPRDQVLQCESVTSTIDSKELSLGCNVNATEETLNNIEGHDMDVTILVGGLSFHPGKVRLESGKFAWGQFVVVVLAIIVVLGLVSIMTLRHPLVRKCLGDHRRDSNDKFQMDPMKWKLDLEEIFIHNSTDDKKFQQLFDQLNECGMLINPREWVTEHQLGSGQFGIVMKAKWQTHNPVTGEPFKCDIAIKVQSRESLGFTEFISEAEIMRDFDHPNVMYLLGVTLHDNAPGIVLPYMDGKDLKKYITSNQITVRELLDFGLQIANGMTYMASRGSVHRDLALRNCMVQRGNPPIVRVADFGLTRETHNEYYSQNVSKESALPFKWMAPEALRYYKYTEKSDVYSYGVTLWELMTRGMTPFEFLQMDELLIHLESGRRLERPEYCPDLIYTIMMRCWFQNPDDRPTFVEVHHDLQRSIELLQESLDNQENHAYYNSYFLKYASNRANLADIDYRAADTRELIDQAQNDLLQAKIGPMTFDPSRDLETRSIGGASEANSAYQFINQLPPDYNEATQYPAPGSTTRMSNDYLQSGPSHRASAPPMSFKSGY